MNNDIMIVMKDYTNTIADRLKEARKEKRFSQEDMGRLLKLSHVSYGAYERGEALPSINTLMELSTVLEKPLFYFLGQSAGQDRYLTNQ